MNSIGEKVSSTKLYEVLCERDSEKVKKTIIWTLAIIGTIAAIAGIAYAVYRYFTPNYLEDFEDDFEDIEDEYFEDEDI